ncbi:hypothetical protein [Alysiella crassa]|uniref:hypothetical protein n=1 Tax=Alysiella crassa TaxID=153491 RepID=UPI001FD3ED44|nr:hypothetical protein [Alysiella crassa]UOP06413.1 hypothetical protein LVJ80_11630 [Alysiella crassa]
MPTGKVDTVYHLQNSSFQYFSVDAVPPTIYRIQQGSLKKSTTLNYIFPKRILTFLRKLVTMRPSE